MGNFDTNQMADRAEAYDGFIQFVDNLGNTYRFHSLQRLAVTFQWVKQDRYDDAGNLARIRNGQNHQFEMDLILTVDEAETTSTPTGPATLAYWIYQLETLKNPVVGTFVGKFFTRTSQSNPWVNLSTSIDIDSIGFARPNGDAISAPVKGRVLGFNSLLRAAS